MMKRSMITMVLTLAGVALWGQKDIALDDFNALSATGNVKVYLAHGEKTNAQLYAEGIPEDEVTVRVAQGILRVASLNSFMYKDAVIKVYVTYTALDEIRATAGAFVKAEAAISAAKLDVHAGSGAQVELALEVQSLDASASEGARLTLSGRAETQEASAATGGQYQAGNLTTKKTYVRSHTGARAEVNAEEHLEISANTGGEVRYHGNPKNKYIKNVLGGDVKQIRKSSGDEEN